MAQRKITCRSGKYSSTGVPYHSPRRAQCVLRLSQTTTNCSNNRKASSACPVTKQKTSLGLSLAADKSPAEQHLPRLMPHVQQYNTALLSCPVHGGAGTMLTNAPASAEVRHAQSLLGSLSNVTAVAAVWAHPVARSTTAVQRVSTVWVISSSSYSSCSYIHSINDPSASMLQQSVR